MHDIGKVVLDQYLDKEYLSIIESSNVECTMELAEKEREVFGMDHGEIGVLLLKKWKFPEEIVKIIGMHHYKILSVSETRKDVAILKIADSLCQKFFYSELELTTIPNCAISDEVIVQSGLSKDYIFSLKEYLELSEEKIYSFFSSIH